jgi:hypothetical protein
MTTAFDRPRVSSDDLRDAVAWMTMLETFGHTSAGRMAAWLRAEIAEREELARVRTIMRATGATMAEARAELRAAEREAATR